MSLRRAPIALRIPISRVRSVTRDEHDVHHADPADEQGDRGHLAEQRGEHAAGFARGFQQRALVEDAEAGFRVFVILWRSSMIDVTSRFGGVEDGFGLRLHGDRVDRADPGERVLHGRDRRHHDAVLVGGAVGALFREHADDFVVAAVDLHRLADGARAAEQFLDDFLADHRDAAVLGDVFGGERAAFGELVAVGGQVGGGGADERGRFEARGAVRRASRRTR